MVKRPKKFREIFYRLNQTRPLLRLVASSHLLLSASMHTRHCTRWWYTRRATKPSFSPHHTLSVAIEESNGAPGEATSEAPGEPLPRPSLPASAGAGAAPVSDDAGRSPPRHATEGRAAGDRPLGETAPLFLKWSWRSGLLSVGFCWGEMKSGFVEMLLASVRRAGFVFLVRACCVRKMKKSLTSRRRASRSMRVRVSCCSSWPPFVLCTISSDFRNAVKSCVLVATKWVLLRVVHQICA